MLRLLLIVPILFLIAMVILPFNAILHYNHSTPMWAQVLSDHYYAQRLFWTLLQAILTIIITSILAIPVAWVLAHFQFLGKSWLLRLLMLPFMMPTLVAGIGILTLFGEQGLLWRGWTDTPYLLLYGNIFFNLPVMIHALYQGLLTIPGDRLNAARIAGASTWQCFWYVERPVLTTWGAGGACLIFLYCISGFGLALLLGGQHYATIEVEIYQLIAYQLDINHAAVLAWLIFTITLSASIIYAMISRRTTNAKIHTYCAPTITTPSQRLLWLFALFILFICSGLPLIAILFSVLRAGSSWQVLWETNTLLALWNTIRFTILCVITSAILGILQAILAHQFPLTRSFLFIPLAVSPACLSFGLLLYYNEYTDSLWMLISLYTLIAYPFVSKDILSKLDSLPINYINAARVFGANHYQIIKYITLPLLLPTLRRALTLAAATGIGEFAATLFLSRPEWATLTTLIYENLGKVGKDNYDRAMVLTFVLMALSSVIFTILAQTETHKSNF